MRDNSLCKYEYHYTGYLSYEDKCPLADNVTETIIGVMGGGVLVIIAVFGVLSFKKYLVYQKKKDKLNLINQELKQTSDVPSR